MIKVTNDTENFIEKEFGELFIYGAGNAGYWLGHYMNRCGIDFAGYLDRKVYHDTATYNDKPIFFTEKLKGYEGKSIRLIVTPRNYESVLSDILWLSHLYGFHAYCLIPRYKHVATHEEGYHINKLLSYFRGKLIIGETPTILANNCLGGRFIAI